MTICIFKHLKHDVFPTNPHSPPQHTVQVSFFSVPTDHQSPQLSIVFYLTKDKKTEKKKSKIRVVIDLVTK